MIEHPQSSDAARRYRHSFLRTSAQYFDLAQPDHRVSRPVSVRRTSISRANAPARRSSARAMPMQL